MHSGLLSGPNSPDVITTIGRVQADLTSYQLERLHRLLHHNCQTTSPRSRTTYKL